MHWTFRNRCSDFALDHQDRSISDEVFRVFPARTPYYAARVANHLLPRLCRCRGVQVQKHPFYQRGFFSQTGGIFKARALSDFAFARCVGRFGCRPASAVRHGYNYGRWLARSTYGRFADHSGTGDSSYGLRNDLLCREPDAGLYGNSFLLVLASHPAAGPFAARDRNFRPRVRGGKGRRSGAEFWRGVAARRSPRIFEGIGGGPRHLLLRY